MKMKVKLLLLFLVIFIISSCSKKIENIGLNYDEIYELTEIDITSDYNIVTLNDNILLRIEPSRKGGDNLGLGDNDESRMSYEFFDVSIDYILNALTDSVGYNHLIIGEHHIPNLNLRFDIVSSADEDIYNIDSFTIQEDINKVIKQLAIIFNFEYGLKLLDTEVYHLYIEDNELFNNTRIKLNPLLYKSNYYALGSSLGQRGNISKDKKKFYLDFDDLEKLVNKKSSGMLAVFLRNSKNLQGVISLPILYGDWGSSSIKFTLQNLKKYLDMFGIGLEPRREEFHVMMTVFK